MGYWTDIDEYRESQLVAEIEMRRKEREAGKCDYCHRPHGVEPSCKFPERHRGEAQ